MHKMRFRRHVVDTSSLFHCCTPQKLCACLTRNQDDLMILLIPLYNILQTLVMSMFLKTITYH